MCPCNSAIDWPLMSRIYSLTMSLLCYILGVDMVPQSNTMPCNNRFRELADVIADEVEKAGGKAHIAMTPVISDGITNGSKPMRYSLVSRDYIADCLEIMHGGCVPRHPLTPLPQRVCTAAVS
jgi:hypothetical protein